MPVRKPGGRSSRSKGSRGEYAVRDYFRALGYEADRVPSSGAAQGFKGDVKIQRPGHEPEIIEVKSRAKQFHTLYQLIGDQLGICFNHLGVLVQMSYHFTDLLKSDILFRNIDTQDKGIKRTLDKILKMREYLKGADYLVVKDDFRPLIFIRYL